MNEPAVGDALDWLHEQGKRRARTVPEFDPEATLRKLRAARDADAYALSHSQALITAQEAVGNAHPRAAVQEARLITKIPGHYAAEVAHFYEAHASWLFAHARLRTQRDQELAASKELAADLVQDTFEAAAVTWKTVRKLPEAQQRAWLRTTLAHKETDHFRRQMALRRRQPDLHHRYQAADADTEQQALSTLALGRAAEIIQGLPARQQRIALMTWNDQMKLSEIAAELDCTVKTVAAQIREIRRKLRDGLGPYYPFAGDDGGGEASR